MCEISDDNNKKPFTRMNEGLNTFFSFYRFTFNINFNFVKTAVAMRPLKFLMWSFPVDRCNSNQQCAGRLVLSTLNARASQRVQAENIFSKLTNNQCSRPHDSQLALHHSTCILRINTSQFLFFNLNGKIDYSDKIKNESNQLIKRTSHLNQVWLCLPAVGLWVTNIASLE